MSMKLLMGLSEENSELERQVGCMTGIFQVFDRHHLITGRRFSGQSTQRLPPGQSHSSISTCTEEYNQVSPQTVLENQRVSLSSSSSSSFSSTKSKSADIGTKSTRSDFGSVVKDCINSGTRVLAVNTPVKENVKKDNLLIPTISVDLDDLCEVPRFSCDGREMLRSKSTTKLRELPRLSLDSRERSLQASSSETEPKEIYRSSLGQGMPSVVAKLMGLESMPSSAPQEPTELCEKDRIVHPLKSSDHTPEQTESVYSQIERRVKELEFPQSHKDLRARKHAMDTMQAKGMLENKESKLTSDKNQNLKRADSHNPKVTTPRAFESPIAIMKPAKSIKRPGDLVEGLSWTSDSVSRRKAKEQTPPSEKRNGERVSQKIRMPLIQRSPRPQQPVREKSGSLVKAPSSSSPRVQQRKLEQEKKPPRPSARKQNASRKPLGPVLSNANLRAEPRREKIDDLQGREAEEISQRKNDDINLATMVNSPPYQQDNQKVQNDDSSSTVSSTVSVEQPSPISVLDATFYQDDLPLSPVKKISCAIEDDEFQTSPAVSLVNTAPLKLSSETHLQKLFGISNLVEQLRILCSTNDIDDHVSEILMNLQEESLQPKSKAERLHQELVLNVLEEILACKLELMSTRLQHNLRQYLLKELCSEIKQLLIKQLVSTTSSGHEECLVFGEGLLRQADGWEDFGTVVPRLVLEVERSIFKDLVDEVVTGEACLGLNNKSLVQA